MSEQLDDLWRQHEDIAQMRRETERRLDSLPEDQEIEADELRGRLRELDEQEAGTNEALADMLQRARARQEPTNLERRSVMIQERVRNQTARRNDLAKSLDNLSRQAGEIERQLASLDNRETDEAHGLEADLDRTRRQIGEVQDQLRQLEQESARPEAEQEGRVRGRGGRSGRSEDISGSGRGGGRPAPEQGNRIIRIYRLARANPAQVRMIVQSLLGASGQVSADERTGSLVVTATPDGQGRVERVIRELDVPAENRDLRNEVDDLRNQMNGLREQLHEMQGLLQQITERRQSDQPR